MVKNYLLTSLFFIMGISILAQFAFPNSLFSNKYQGDEVDEEMIWDQLVAGEWTNDALQYTDYYSSIGSETCENLKTALHELIDGHTTVSYGSLWTHFQSTDDHLNDTGAEVIVWDMYSDNPNGPENEFTFVTEQCGNFQDEGDCYNREHTFPKSWWGGSTSPAQYTDLFAVIPSDGWVNGLRSNYPYGEVQSGMHTDITANGCKVGPSATTIPGYNGPVFEPVDAYKGDLARGYFYMATRYQHVISTWENNSTSSDAVLDGSSFTVFEPWKLNLLISWHTDDPVDQKELDRNDAIYAIQGNRNPFIDHPEYVQDIWSDCPDIDSCIYVYTTADDGMGSLRSAIDCAVSGDTILFSSAIFHSSISLTSDWIEINKNIVLLANVEDNIRIEANPSPTSSISSIFKINSGAQVSLCGFSIDGADGIDGIAISNDGILTLDNMSLTSGTNTQFNSVLYNNTASSLIYKGTNTID